MDVILLERVARLGDIGEVVKVKPGFGRNFLIPQQKALRATKANREVFEAQRDVLEQRNNEQKSAAQALVEKLNGLTVTVVRQASEGGQLYGSVSVRDISDALEAEGHKVDRSIINLNQAIKALGLYTVTVRPYAQIEAEIRVHVARNADSPIPAELLEDEQPAEEAAAAAPEDAEAVDAAAVDAQADADDTSVAESDDDAAKEEASA